MTLDAIVQAVGVEPYFRDDAVVIYHADCRDILPLIPPGSADLVLTDPPYGVGLEYQSHHDSLLAWRSLIGFLVPWMKARARMGILPSCQINELRWIYEHHPPDWLICWYKGSPGTTAYVGFNDWEPLLVYGKTPGLSMHDYFYAQPQAVDGGHPCPKPLAWATWLIERIKAKTILDPFLGSGTTARAAKDLGRFCVGIEVEEKYCAIAAQRMSQMVMPLEAK